MAIRSTIQRSLRVAVCKMACNHYTTIRVRDVALRVSRLICTTNIVALMGFTIILSATVELGQLRPQIRPAMIALPAKAVIGPIRKLVMLLLQ